MGVVAFSLSVSSIDAQSSTETATQSHGNSAILTKIDTLRSEISELNSKTELQQLSTSFNNLSNQFSTQLTQLIDSVRQAPTLTQLEDTIIKTKAETPKQAIDKLTSALIDRFDSLEKSVNELKSNVAHLVRQQAKAVEEAKHNQELAHAVQTLQRQQSDLLHYFNRSTSSYSLSLSNIHSHLTRFREAVHAHALSMLKSLDVHSWQDLHDRLVALWHRLLRLVTQYSKHAYSFANTRYTLLNSALLKKAHEFKVPKHLAQILVSTVLVASLVSLLMPILCVLGSLCAGIFGSKKSPKSVPKKKKIVSAQQVQVSKKQAKVVDMDENAMPPAK